MAKSGIVVDTKEFDADFKRIVNHAIPELREKGMWNAAWELLADSDDVVPQTPFGDRSTGVGARGGAKKGGGDLRGSAKVEIERKRNDVIAWAGFNIVYASYVHEGLETWNWTKTHVPNPGPKFLESKLAPNRDKYMRIVADTIRNGAK